jgi:hypothetical protein
MKDLLSFIQDTGDYAYASARCRAIIGSLKNAPRQTKEAFESSIQDELGAFEKKLVRIAPASLKEDLAFFFQSKRDVEELKIQFRRYHLDKKRREGLKVVSMSTWGSLVKEKMSNREVELALDSRWFHVMKTTRFREFVIDLEQLYLVWYKHRSAGKRFDYDPLLSINKIANSNPLGWGVLLKCYYEKLKQAQMRRRMAWEGY